MRLAVIGRPNVGKSSLVNAFLGRERVIVSPNAGTTRDAIDTPIEFDGRKLLLVDTAGIRRAAKVSESVEYYTTLRSQRAAERADVALVVCDATDGVTSQDLRIADLAMRSGCATALVLNKWDLTGGDVDAPVGPGGGVGAAELDRERARVNRKLRLRPSVLTASAVSGRNVRRLLQEALSLADRARHRIPTPEINRFLADVDERPPAAGEAGTPAEDALHGPDRGTSTAVLHSGEQPRRGSPAITPITLKTDSESATRSTGSPSSSTSPSASNGAEQAERAHRNGHGAHADGNGANGNGNGRARPQGAPRTSTRRRFWTRRRTLTALAALALAAGVLGALVARGDAARPDGAARLVPAGALPYVHLSTGGDGDERLWAAASRFTHAREGLGRLAIGLTPTAARLDYERDIEPWVGGEVALAVLDGPRGRLEPLLLAEAADRRQAGAMLSRFGAQGAGWYRGTPLRRMRGAPATIAAFAGDFVAIGTARAVRAAIDRAQGRGAALADAGTYRRAVAARGTEGALDVFVPAGSLRRLLDGEAGPTGAARFAARLLAGPRAQALSARVGAEDGGVRIAARLLEAGGGQRARGFAPALTHRVPAGAAAHLGLPGLEDAARLLARAGGGPLLEDLRAALPEIAGVDLDRDLLAPLHGEAAAERHRGRAAHPSSPSAPARATSRARARRSPASSAPVAERLAGGAPFAERRSRGATRSRSRSPSGCEPSYAVADGAARRLHGARRPRAAAPRAARPLAGLEALRAVAPEAGARVEALGFLAPRQLLALGERTGLAGRSLPGGA